jgi:hypothetical protein
MRGAGGPRTGGNRDMLFMVHGVRGPPGIVILAPPEVPRNDSRGKAKAGIPHWTQALWPPMRLSVDSPAG